MALAPSWESVAAPEIRTPALSLPIRRTGTIPTYPPGRHRGARRSWMYALLTALVPTSSYVGRHRPSPATTAYQGRHRG